MENVLTTKMPTFLCFDTKQSIEILFYFQHANFPRFEMLSILFLQLKMNNSATLKKIYVIIYTDVHLCETDIFITHYHTRSLSLCIPQDSNLCTRHFRIEFFFLYTIWPQSKTSSQTKTSITKIYYLSIFRSTFTVVKLPTCVVGSGDHCHAESLVSNPR